MSELGNQLQLARKRGPNLAHQRDSSTSCRMLPRRETAQLVKEYAASLTQCAPRAEPRVPAGSRRLLPGRQTKRDLTGEVIHTRTGITRMINANYPGSANKDVRTHKTAAVQAVEETCKCMLENLDTHITVSGAATLKTLRGDGERGHDQEYTRRQDTNSSIYLLNYLLCRVIMDSPEARSEAVNDGHKLERTVGETAPASGRRLLVPRQRRAVGRQQRACQAQVHQEGEREQEKTLKELQVWLAYMISLEPVRSKPEKRARKEKGGEPTSKRQQFWAMATARPVQKLRQQLGMPCQLTLTSTRELPRPTLDARGKTNDGINRNQT